MNRRLVTIRTRNGMRRLREAGKSISAIQADYPEWADSTIRRHVGDIKVPRTSWTRKVDPAAALRLHEAGVKFSEIGERFGVSKVAAFYAYRKAVRRREEARA